MEKKIIPTNSRKKLVLDNRAHDVKSLALLLREHNDEDYVPFHMPGHKRSKKYSFLSNVQELDITEIEGFDDLHNAEGLLLEAQKRAAEFFGVRESRFLTCGSTSGVLAAIRALTADGDEVLIARNCHKSVYNAVELCGLRPYYVNPTYFEEYGFYGSVMPDDVEAELEAHPNTKLVVITSPTYEGVLSNIKAIAKICHSHGAYLFVDEAHGAHLGLSRKFEQSARSLGADVVVNSLHKTLPSLTQTAILHVCTDAVDVGAIDRNLSLFQTSSPSYVLMASIDGCLQYLAGEGVFEFEIWNERIDKFRKSMSKCKRIKLFEYNGDGRVYAYDKTKLVFLTVESAISGIALMRALRSKYKIELEMASANYVLAMTGAGDTIGAYLTLSEAIYEVDNNVKERNGLTKMDSLGLPKKVVEPCQMRILSTEFSDLEAAIGRVSAENVWAFPPCSPILVKGEVVSKEFVRHAMLLYECGINVYSEYKEFPNKLLVVVESRTKNPE
ncbi:MAG: aminotransferase class I/II-fold pyridoxal phosphate-dependent enzyme [Clostridia bacterium]|nr:aminotransferase class I/II-fold pyridoxal phosphate-dependent enzyme [Clostridia bacterium]